ncbi:MAG: pyruvoyl-dependent arginine decarboxylase [Halobacteriales archaeon]
MVQIFIADGTGTGPTAQAAYDAALAAAGVARYNLVTLSSVVPADASVEVVERVPDRGAVGDVLHVVQAKVLAREPATAVAGLAWARSSGGEGIFYEASDAGEAASARTLVDELETGLEHGVALRSWTPVTRDRHIVERGAPASGVVAAVVVAAVGEARAPW